MKKNYQKPTMQVAEIEQTNIICVSPGPAAKSVTTNLTGNDAINYGGAGSGNARSRRLDWDEEDDELFLDW